MRSVNQRLLNNTRSHLQHQNITMKYKLSFHCTPYELANCL